MEKDDLARITQKLGSVHTMNDQINGAVATGERINCGSTCVGAGVIDGTWALAFHSESSFDWANT